MTVAGLATIPTRIEQVKRTIESLLPQVERINLSMNNFTDYPKEFMCDGIYKKVYPLITQGTDEQKFRHVCGDYYFPCDDDLEYAPDYVRTMKERLEHYDIVTCHGRNFNTFPIRSYYKSAGSKYRCLDKVATDVPVMVGGTGCMAFRPANFKVSLADFPTKYMADIHLAIAAMKQGKRIMCIAHEAGWIKYQPVNDTIYDRFANDDAEQTALINANFV